MCFCATNVTRYFKNTVSLARILNEILKFSVLQVLYLYNYSIKVMKKITIVIDGFSSCGKSTMAKDLAREIGYIYIDSGAMYRAVTLYSIENGIFQGDRIDAEKLKSLIKDIHISFRLNPETGRPDTYLNGVNVENKIRTMEVSSRVSPIATLISYAKLWWHSNKRWQGQGYRYGWARHRHYRFSGCRAENFVTATPRYGHNAAMTN